MGAEVISFELDNDTEKRRKAHQIIQNIHNVKDEMLENNVKKRVILKVYLKDLIAFIE